MSKYKNKLELVQDKLLDRITEFQLMTKERNFMLELETMRHLIVEFNLLPENIADNLKSRGLIGSDQYDEFKAVISSSLGFMEGEA